MNYRPLGLLFLAASVMAASPWLAVAADGPPQVVCLGTEPGWQFDLNGKDGHFTASAMPEGSYVGQFTALEARNLFVWRGKPSEGEAGDFVAFMRKVACNDGMSDREYPYDAQASLPDGTIVTGCCNIGPLPPEGAAVEPVDLMAPGNDVRIDTAAGTSVNVRREPAVAPDNVVVRARGSSAVTVKETRQVDGKTWYLVQLKDQPESGWIRGDFLAPIEPEVPSLVAAVSTPAAGAPASPPAGDWSPVLVDLLPAIDACLAAIDAKPGRVARAALVDAALAGVRLVDAGGKHWNCFAETTGGNAKRIDPAANTPLTPAAETVLFTRAPGAPPTGGCYDTREVADPAGGSPLGWLSHPIC